MSLLATSVMLVAVLSAQLSGDELRSMVQGVLLGVAATALVIAARRGRRTERRHEDEADAGADGSADAASPATSESSLLHRLIEATSLSEDVILILDADGRVEWANRRACVRRGRRLDDLRGGEAFGEKDGYRIDADTQRRLATDLAAGTAFIETMDNHSASGRVRRLDVRGRPIPSPDGGAPAGWVIVEREVTELRERTDLLDLVLDAARAGMWDWDVDTGVTRTTPNMHRMIDEPVPTGPVSIDWFRERVHPEDADALDTRLDAALADDEEPFEVTFRFGRAGHWTWVRTAGRVIERMADGQPRRMIGLHVDLDELHRSMAAASDATQLLHAIIDLVPVRIWWKDLEGRYLGANQAYRQDHGNVSIVGRTDADLDLDPEEQARRRRREERAIADGCSSGDPERDETNDPARDPIEAWTRPDGSGGWRTPACRPLHDEQGTIIGTIGSYQDVTELQEAAAELARARDHAEAANLAKSEFLANMSHEIRTPMTAILGFTDLLDEPGEEERAVRRRQDAVETIRRNGAQLLAILSDILDLSRIEAGKLTVERLPVSPMELVGDVMQLMAARAEGKGLSLACACETPVPTLVRTDPVRVRQILTNVVGNAIKFTETGGVELRVAFLPGDAGAESDVEARRGAGAGADEGEGAGARAGADAGRLRITVRDTGIGMRPEQVETVFDAFAQADSSTTRRFGGTGLGLRISRSLAAALDGDLTCESRPAEGSSFVIELGTPMDAGTTMLPPDLAVRQAGSTPSSTSGMPTPATRIPGPTADRDGTPPLEGVRILLAEDGPDNQRLIGFLLRKAGATAEIAVNGRLAVDAVRTAAAAGEPFDLVLMDVQMPELDGYAATGELRAGGCDLPIIALTAHAMAGDRERSLAAGCNEHLTKPVDRTALVRTIQSWTERRREDRRAA